MKVLRISITALMLTALFTAQAMAAQTQVRLDAVGNGNCVTVDFGSYAPTVVNDRTYVHSRGFADAAGIKITWDSDSKTAFIKVIADADSQKPIEVYAARRFELLNDRAPGVPSDITISMTLHNSSALLRYNYLADGKMEGLGKTIPMDGATYMENDSALMIPLRGAMEALGLTVGWEQETLTAAVSVPKTVSVPDGLEYIDYWLPPQDYYIGDAPPNYIPDGVHELGEYLGNFRITKYCPCNICNGSWGGYTAWAGEIIPGQTIGVNPDIIPKLAWVYIDGIGWRRAEDTGGGIGTYHIDMAVSNHYEATHHSLGSRDVWIAK